MTASTYEHLNPAYIPVNLRPPQPGGPAGRESRLSGHGLFGTDRTEMAMGHPQAEEPPPIDELMPSEDGMRVAAPGLPPGLRVPVLATDLRRPVSARSGLDRRRAAA